MRGNITLNILRLIAEKSLDAIALCEAIIVAGYGASYSQIQRAHESRRVSENIPTKRIQEIKHRRQNYQKLLSKLKHEGLITAKLDSNGKHLFITPRGKIKLSVLEKKETERLPAIYYRRTKQRRPIIVAFDVPEKERGKRDWLREVLKHLGLKMIQQSVWVGTQKLPEEFLEDLRRLNLVEHVEIFEVGKSGTLRYIA